MALKLITPPAAEPITVDEAKVHLRVFGTDDDALIGSLITAARQGAEHLTGRALMPQTWELALDSFEREIRPPNPPLASIVSVKYIDQAGAEQTLAPADYLLDNHSEPARLVPVYGTSWPATRREPSAVRVRYVAGYADASAVPQAVKSWMLLRIGALYENRESEIVGARVASLSFVDGLLYPYKIWSI